MKVKLLSRADYPSTPVLDVEVFDRAEWAALDTDEKRELLEVRLSHLRGEVETLVESDESALLPEPEHVRGYE